MAKAFVSYVSRISGIWTKMMEIKGAIINVNKNCCTF